MTIPVWVLLAFTGWTVLLMLTTIGVFRWSKILTGQAGIHEFPAEEPKGSDFYLRAMRAHLNCLENLPLYGAVVLVLVVAALNSYLLDILALIFLGARIGQSITHVAFRITAISTAWRSGLYTIQLICLVWMGIYAVLYA